MRTIALFRDHLIGVVRVGHRLSEGVVTAARYAAERHVGISPTEVEKGPVDEALGALGLARDIVATVSGFATALSLARATDLVASVPARHTGRLREGMHGFALPMAVPEVTVSMLWHPRQDADPAHLWLRACLRDICGG